MQWGPGQISATEFPHFQIERFSPQVGRIEDPRTATDLSKLEPGSTVFNHDSLLNESRAAPSVDCIHRSSRL